MDMAYYKKYEPIFGDWRIVQEIGSGSYGKVFEIERKDFSFTYKAALKAITIPQDQRDIERLMDDSMDGLSATNYYRGFVQELVEEFQLMSKLKGETNIVSYEDHRVIPHEDGIGWDILIRMELLTPLPKYVKKHPMSQADVVRLGIDICSALELCREQNIVHRDIKPDNIFVSERGKFKLGDFGIARTVEKTMSGLSKKGTYNYMAPEVYKGEDYGPSVDIYSLGIVLYRYLNNNRLPFLPQPPEPFGYNEDSAARARRMKGEAIPAPVNADSELAAIVLKACAFDSKDRYHSPTEMREALEAVPAGLAPLRTVTASDEASVKYGKTIALAHVNGKTDETAVLSPDLETETGEKTTVLTDSSSIDENMVEIENPVAPEADGATVLLSDLKQEEIEKTTVLTENELPGDEVSEAEVLPVEGTTLLPGDEPTQADTIRSAPKAAAAKESAAPKADNKPNRKYIAAAALLALVIALGAVAFGNSGGSSPVVDTESTNNIIDTESTDAPESTDTSDDSTKSQTSWSDWSEDLPSTVSKSEYSVEKKTQYRSRDKETKASTTSSKMDGWTLEETVDSGEYGAWSDWSTTAVSASDSRKVETQTQYRYRSKSTSQQYTSWGSWSSWSTNSVSSSSTKEVQSATFYRYYYFYCPVCGRHEPFRDICDCGQYTLTSANWNEKWFQTPYSQSNYSYFSYTNTKCYTTSLGDGQKWIFSAGNRNSTSPGTVDSASSAVVIRTQYRYRTRSLQNVTSYGDWSDWSSSAVASTSTCDVQTRTVYRYRDKTSQKTYVFSRWSDWSEWSDTPAYKSDTKQVETKTVYRYKAK